MWGHLLERGGNHLQRKTALKTQTCPGSVKKHIHLSDQTVDLSQHAFVFSTVGSLSATHSPTCGLKITRFSQHCLLVNNRCLSQK